MTTQEIVQCVLTGETTARSVVDGCLERIANTDATIGAFLEVFEADARLAADVIDTKRARGEGLGVLAGVPIALKDNILVAGKTATSGSRILESYVAPYSATVVERLQAADAIIIGRTNMDEFACGSSTETSAWGQTRNPRDPDRVPGGSSGGSAAAVAANMVPVALGSDTGGSIRQPASLCGVVGFKPTYGAVSRYGLMAMASSLDQIGPFATSVADAASIFRVIAGKDPHDQTSINVDLAIPELGGVDVRGRKVGLPTQYLGEGLHPGIRERVQSMVERLREGGATVVELDLPILGHALATYYVLMPAEVSSNLNRYDGLQFGRPVSGETLRDQIINTRSQGFGEEVQRRILLGTFVLSAGSVDAYYKQALKVRGAIMEAVADAFQRVDVLVGPTSPELAWKFGEKSEDPLTMYLADMYTVVANLVGCPALSLPMPDVDGLPAGFHLMAPRGHDARVFEMAQWLEQHAV